MRYLYFSNAFESVKGIPGRASGALSVYSFWNSVIRRADQILQKLFVLRTIWTLGWLDGWIVYCYLLTLHQDVQLPPASGQWPICHTGCEKVSDAGITKLYIRSRTGSRSSNTHCWKHWAQEHHKMDSDKFLSFFAGVSLLLCIVPAVDATWPPPVKPLGPPPECGPDKDRCEFTLIASYHVTMVVHRPAAGPQWSPVATRPDGLWIKGSQPDCGAIKRKLGPEGTLYNGVLRPGTRSSTLQCCVSPQCMNKCYTIVFIRHWLYTDFINDILTMTCRANEGVKYQWSLAQRVYIAIFFNNIV